MSHQDPALRAALEQAQSLVYQLEMLQNLALDCTAETRYQIGDYAVLLSLLITPLRCSLNQLEQRLLSTDC